MKSIIATGLILLIMAVCALLLGTTPISVLSLIVSGVGFGVVIGIERTGRIWQRTSKDISDSWVAHCERSDAEVSRLRTENERLTRLRLDDQKTILDLLHD